MCELIFIGLIVIAFVLHRGLEAVEHQIYLLRDEEEATP